MNKKIVNNTMVDMIKLFNIKDNLFFSESIYSAAIFFYIFNIINFNV